MMINWVALGLFQYAQLLAFSIDPAHVPLDNTDSYRA